MSTNVFVIHFGANAPFKYHENVAHFVENTDSKRIRAMLTVLLSHTLGKEVIFAFDLSGDESWRSRQHAIAATYFAMREERLPLSPAEDTKYRYHLAFTTAQEMEELGSD